MPAAADDRTLHRALADTRRTRILDELERSGEPLDVHELADRLGVHPNTVRWHLGVLAGAGLVRSRPAHRATPGRPRIVYERDRGAGAAGRDDYRLLATVLAELAAGSERDCVAAGRAWGRRLPEHRERPAASGEAVAGVAALLDEQGFAPVVADGTIEMHRCPFHDLAETHPEVVCGVHRGLVDGALEALGSPLRVTDLEIYPRPDLCRLHLGSRA